MLSEKVFSTIKQHNMFSAGDTVAVCLSGGADSMALFHFLCTNREKLGVSVIALHVNHGLRTESRQEEVFVADYCRSMGVQCIITHLDMNNNTKPQGLSTESWARDLRYSFFFEQAKAHNAILATAHTLSDRAETVLFNITRGTSLKGAAGIPAVRDNIVRPLIDCSRDDIEKYCRDNSIPFVTDKTNFEDIYSRNKIRLNVIPQLKKINPAAEKAIASFAADSREIYSLLSQLSDSIYRQALGLGGLEVSVLSSRHPAVVKNLIRNNLDKLDCLSKDNVEAIYNALGCDSFKRQLSATVFCRIRDGRLSFYTPKQKTSDTVPQSLAVEFGTEILFGYSTLRFSVVTAEEYEKIAKNCKNYLTYAVNYDILKGVLKLRSRKTGDRFTITGRNVTKTLKKLFIEDKVPQDFRDRIPVLCDETDAVVWLGDYGTNKPYVPDENTKNILLITQI
ncbi:MAG: tRNA lysidine(34) synthetase TilS [Oscillospiraceae bacterium]|nr:tRNA lysidine(34) synthetase TilS [Oscillospiraceae bacterium]